MNDPVPPLKLRILGTSLPILQASHKPRHAHRSFVPLMYTRYLPVLLQLAPLPNSHLLSLHFSVARTPQPPQDRPIGP